jgi:UDP-glucose:(heptosyl)LPS alpha-1,3-glucosyltransferase
VNTEKRADIKQAQKIREQILAGLDIKEADKPVLFLFAATNFRLKGLSCLLEALKVLAARHKDFSGFLVVVGGGEINKYQQLAEKTIFLGSVDNIQNVLSIIDVAILPTFYDPASRFILEALAAGKPVITTRFNGATDLFTNNRHGIVVDSPENITALTDAVDYFTNEDNIRMASQAIVEDNLRQRISVARIAKELMTVYELILQKEGK